MADVKINEQVLIHNEQKPQDTRYVFGPALVKIEHPWERIGMVEPCTVLDQDDYVVVMDMHGTKRIERGPKVYKPIFGETPEDKRQSVQVPVNAYMIIDDSNNTEHPRVHIEGPCKFYPNPFQTIQRNVKQSLEYFPCIEVTRNRAMHLQKRDGHVILLDTPQFYMPMPGETVLCAVERNVLLLTDFCILKSPNGDISVMNGQRAEDRSFFLQPFQSFVKFSCDVEKTILSTLPTFMGHMINVRTSDNVVMELDLRISYQITDVDLFSKNPIDFYPYIKNHIQNVLLDKFAQATLREFMNTFSKIAQASVEPCSDYFNQFGISILVVQILTYVCVNKDTQELLNTDIQTNVTKQNELRARQNDILIQEQSNEVQRRQKDLEVQLAVKDNEVALQKKKLENEIRLKEMEIEILEEKKRTELLEVRRGNDLVEAEFEGRARGHEFKEFLLGIDPSLTNEQKIAIWTRKCDLEQAKILYSKVDAVSLYPTDADVKIMQFNGSQSSEKGQVNSGILQALGAVSQAGSKGGK